MRGTTGTGWLEAKWKSVFNQFEKSRLRRGKALAKQGSVQSVTVRDQVISALVKGGGGNARGYRVGIPTPDWWVDYADEAASWLSRRPDWLAALFAQQWDDEFVEFIERTGLTLFPEEALVETWCQCVRCSCSDWEPLCVHAAALAYFVVGQMQEQPLTAFTYVGLQAEDVLSRAKRTGAEYARQVLEPQPAAPVEWPANLVWTAEEIACLQTGSDVDRAVQHKIIAELDETKWSAWRDTYMA